VLLFICYFVHGTVNCTLFSIRFLRINLPSGGVQPTAVVFGEGASQLVVATQDLSGAGLCMYASAGGKVAAVAKEQGKLPLPEIKWEQKNVHSKNSIVTLVGATASQGGGVLLASCTEGTDIKLWAADSGKCIGMVDTNQLKNTMAALSPNGRFLAAAAFTADVKVWNGSVHSLPSVWVLFLVILLCAGDH
jgi:WD40 repeat protein